MYDLGRPGELLGLRRRRLCGRVRAAGAAAVTTRTGHRTPPSVRVRTVKGVRLAAAYHAVHEAAGPRAWGRADPLRSERLLPVDLTSLCCGGAATPLRGESRRVAVIGESRERLRHRAMRESRSPSRAYRCPRQPRRRSQTRVPAWSRAVASECRAASRRPDRLLPAVSERAPAGALPHRHDLRGARGRPSTPTSDALSTRL